MCCAVLHSPQCRLFCCSLTQNASQTRHLSRAFLIGPLSQTLFARLSPSCFPVNVYTLRNGAHRRLIFFSTLVSHHALRRISSCLSVPEAMLCFKGKLLARYRFLFSPRNAQWYVSKEFKRGADVDTAERCVIRP